MNLLKQILLEYATILEKDKEGKWVKADDGTPVLSLGGGRYSSTGVPNNVDYTKKSDGTISKKLSDEPMSPDEKDFVKNYDPDNPPEPDKDIEIDPVDPENLPSSRFKDEPEPKAEPEPEPEPEAEPEPDREPVSSEPQKGKVSGDPDDPYSDFSMRQQALENGYQPGAEYITMGNSTSTFNENVSLDGITLLEENPELSVRELAEVLYEQTKDTGLGQQIGDPKKVSSRGKYKGFNSSLMGLCMTTARASKVKYQLLEPGREYLEGPTKTRGYGGTKYGVEKQLQLVDDIPGPFYTVDGSEMTKDEVKYLIENAGEGVNPADTTTIITDDSGTAVIKWWSDKTSTNDPQSNSSPDAELTLYVKYLEGIPDDMLDEESKQYVRGIIQSLSRELEGIEAGLLEVANGPARKMADMDQTELLELIKSGEGVRSSAAKHLGKSLRSRGKPHPNIRPYLPDPEKEDYSDEELLKAFYKYMGDEDRDSEPTKSQLKVMNRSAIQVGMDIGKNLERVREESIRVQNVALNRLNEVTVSYMGQEVPMGNYLEAKNVIEKFHLPLIDGKNSISEVARHEGALSIVMGGVTAEPDQVRDCMGVKNTDDLTLKFEVSEPGNDNLYTRGTDGRITGRNVFLYAVSEEGERFEIGKKVQRSKTGKGGRLQSLYAWGNDMKGCLESKSQERYGLEEEQVQLEQDAKDLIRRLAVRELEKYHGG